MEASGESLAWWLVAQVDIGEEGPETLEDINAHWRACSGFKWPPKVLGTRRSCGMNCSPHSHQGLRAWLRPWSNILWLHGGGTSRCEGRACAHPLPPYSTLASFLLIRRWREVWESHTGLWPTPVCCKGWARWPMEESGRHSERL